MGKLLDIAELRKLTCIEDLLFLDQIQTYILKMTGTLVTKARVGRWIARGKLVVMCLPGRPRYRVTRKRYVNDLIRRYS